MTLNPDQFHEHLDRLSEASGLQYGPNSISTRSGIVLPAMHDFTYSTEKYGPNKSLERLIANTSIPDERGTKHHLNVNMFPSRGDEISSFGLSTVERNEDPHKPYGLSFISYSHGMSNRARNDIQVSNPEEIVERFRSEPIETSERTALESKEHFDYEQETRNERGLQPGESGVRDFRTDPSSSYAYDFRSRNIRPL